MSDLSGLPDLSGRADFGAEVADHTGVHADLDLVLRCLRGERWAAAELVHKHINMVHRIAYGLAGRHTDTEDLTQEIFAQVFKALPSLNQGESLRSWIATIARNQTRTAIRQRIRMRALFDLQSHDEKFPTHIAKEAEAEAHCLAEERRQEVWQALDALSDQEREILVCSMDELSYEGIAKQLGLPLGTVKSRLARARQRLSAILQPFNRKFSPGGGRR